MHEPSYEHMNMNSPIPFMGLGKAFSTLARTAGAVVRSSVIRAGETPTSAIRSIAWPPISRASVLIGTLLFALQTLTAADFTVTTPGFFYAISGMQPNPTLTLVRGRTYTFAI